MSARQALTEHWPEYLIEAGALGTFMVSACFIVSLIELPGSFVHQAVADPFLRRSLIGLGMGLTAIAIIYSPWGKRSGAHLNPAVTLTYYLLGKISPWDTLFYVLFQFAGGIVGVLVARLILGDAIVGSAQVDYVLTQPGVYGTASAFAAEAAISFGLMMAVLMSSNDHRLNAYTGLFAGCLIATYIALEAPAFWHEHESGQKPGLSSISSKLVSALDLLFRPIVRHVPCRRNLPPCPGRRKHTLLQVTS